MTDLSPIECEARLVGLSKQRRKDGDWIEVKFHIHPDDHPAALFILPLGTDCNLSIKGTSEDAAEPPGEQTATAAVEDNPERPKPKIGPNCLRAVLLCKRPEFQSWMMSTLPVATLALIGEGMSQANTATHLLRDICGIESRTELDHSPEAAQRFAQIEADHRAAQQGRTDPEVARQFAEGPS